MTVKYLKEWYEWFSFNFGWAWFWNLIATTILIFVVVAGCNAITNSPVIQGHYKARITCIQNGYPELLKADGIYYCHKLENGNDTIVPVTQLEKQ